MIKTFEYKDAYDNIRHEVYHKGYVWCLDLFSTILSRRYSQYIFCGNLIYTRYKNAKSFYER